MPVPGSPLPLFSVPPRTVDGQVSAAPVAVSVSMNLPDFIDTGPPGRTVQVAATRTVVTPRMATSTAGGTTNKLRAYRFLTCCRPSQGWKRYARSLFVVPPAVLVAILGV